MKPFCRIQILLSLLVIMFTANAKINTKFNDKITKFIWQNEQVRFDPKTPVADSVLAENSAVIIAWLDDIDVDNEVHKNMYKRSGLTNRVVCRHTKRRMVYLGDQSAVDKFSKFEFDGEVEVKTMVVLYTKNEAFGARVYKPDGTVNDVDINTALEVADGKKGNENSKYRIAIPGLQPGDVLEYFYYTEESADDFNLPSIDVDMYARYPILYRDFRLRFNPYLTVETKNFNGVPRLIATKQKDDDILISTAFANLPAIKTEKYLNANRQLPFVRINILNNTSYRYHPKTARTGGFYGDMPMGIYYADIFNYFKDAAYETSLPAEATRLVNNNFLKQNPKASKPEIADAAYLAFCYLDMIDEKSTSSNPFKTMFLVDTFDKLKVAPRDSIGFAFFNNLYDVPTEQISAWDEPHYVAMVGSKFYDPTLRRGTPPGQIKATYQGQAGGHLFGDVKNMAQSTVCQPISVPALSYSQNSTNDNTTISFDSEGVATMNRATTLSGLEINKMDELTGRDEWLDIIEDYFQIPADKRYKATDRDDVAREREVREMLRKDIEKYLGQLPDSIMAYEITDRPVLPGHSNLSYNVTATFKDFVQTVGDNLVLNVGLLTGSDKRLPASERTRLVDGWLAAPSMAKRNINIQIPEGYEVDEESLAALAVMRKNNIGNFAVQPRLSDDGRELNLMFVQNFKMSTVPLKQWGKMLDLLDAAADYLETRLVLVPKKQD